MGKIMGVNGGVCSRNILAYGFASTLSQTLISYTKSTHTVDLVYLLATDQIFHKYAVSVFLSLQ